MLFIADVNIIVYAYNREAPLHEWSRTWLERTVQAEDFALPAIVWVSVVRILTSPRILPTPMATSDAIGIVAGMLAQPRVHELAPGPLHMATFLNLCETTNARGDAIPDAYLAALAIEHGATLCTADRGFQRFSGLTVLNPADEARI